MCAFNKQVGPHQVRSGPIALIGQEVICQENRERRKAPRGPALTARAGTRRYT